MAGTSVDVTVRIKNTGLTWFGSVELIIHEIIEKKKIYEGKVRGNGKQLPWIQTIFLCWIVNLLRKASHCNYDRSYFGHVEYAIWARWRSHTRKLAPLKTNQHFQIYLVPASRFEPIQSTSIAHPTTSPPASILLITLSCNIWKSQIFVNRNYK